MGVLNHPGSKSVPRQPLPVTWTVGSASTPSGEIVILDFETPAGESTYFMRPEEVFPLVENLRETARRAKGKPTIVAPDPEEIRRILGNGKP